MTKQARTVALALQFNGGAASFSTQVARVEWTREGVEVLRQIHRASCAGAKQLFDQEAVHLPFLSLHTRLNVLQSEWVTLSEDVGLRYFAEEVSAIPFGYVRSSRLSRQTLYDVLSGWLEVPFARFADKFGVPLAAMIRLRRLLDDGKLIQVEEQAVKLYPWGSPVRGEEEPFPLAASEIASCLAGKEIFPELGPMYRIVGAISGNRAELMTMPRQEAGGFFSLVCEISLETYPGAPQPLVYIRCHRRRWATSFGEKTYKVRRIGGFVMAPRLRPGMAFRFDVNYKATDGWQTDHAFDDLAAHLDLLPGFQHEYVVSYPKDAESVALVMQKAGTTESDGSKLDAGVPVADQIDAFERVCEELSPLGFIPFSGYETVKHRTQAVRKLGLLKASLVLAHLADLGPQEGTPGDEAIDERIVDLTRRPLSYWFGKDRPGLDANYGNLAELVQLVVRESGVDQDAERRTLYVLMQPSDEQPWIKAVIELLLGDVIRVVAVSLPSDTHGAMEQLPAKEGNKVVRFDARVQAWRKFATSHNFGPRPMFLVQAPNSYQIDGKWRPDDLVNKAAARRTLTAELGATVQYLLPTRQGRLKEYLIRLQAAVLDLVFGHVGRVVGLEALVRRSFPDEASRPREVIAIGSASVNLAPRQTRTVLAAVRIDIENGRTLIRIGHQESAEVFSDWMRFDDGLRYLSRRSKLSIATGKGARGFFQRFVASTLGDVAATDPNAIAFIDSTRYVARWSYLKDRTKRTGEIVFEGGVEVPKACATLRIVRVRDLAPAFVHLNPRPARSADIDYLQIPTSVQRLIRVPVAELPTYWSVAKPIGHPKRGVSCYRPRLLLDNEKKPALHPADFGQHQTPRGTEFAVLQCQPHDDANQLAILGHHLRAGVPQAPGEMWVKTPAPLHTIRKLEDYMGF